MSDDQKNMYAYEKYEENNGLKVIYNGEANRNIERINIGKPYWLSSRCVDAYWYSSRFYLRFVSGSSIMRNYVLISNTNIYSYCRGLRPDFTGL